MFSATSTFLGGSSPTTRLPLRRLGLQVLVALLVVIHADASSASPLRTTRSTKPNVDEIIPRVSLLALGGSARRSEVKRLLFARALEEVSRSIPGLQPADTSTPAVAASPPAERAGTQATVQRGLLSLSMPRRRGASNSGGRIAPTRFAYDSSLTSTTPPEFVATETGINEAGGVGDKPYGPEVPAEGGGTAKPDLVKGNDKYIEGQTGESAHEIKEGVVGSTSGSKYDLYVDKKTGEIFVVGKGGKGEPQPTGLKIPRK